VSDPLEYLSKIKVGRDGLIVRHSFSSGLLLPQVPVEYGWNTEEFLQHTCEKAGLARDTWKNESVEIEKFENKYKKIVIKPTHGYGGKNIFLINKKLSRSKISKYLNKHRHVMAQKFLPQIKNGDKRIFIINGVIKGAIKRIPKKGSIVSNIGQGGKAVKTTLTKNEYHIAKIVASDLKKSHIVFAGIDLISNYLTGDINITSPTGLKNFKDLTGVDLAVDFWNFLEKR